jgi:hypothetical protein
VLDNTAGALEAPGRLGEMWLLDMVNFSNDRRQHDLPMTRAMVVKAFRMNFAGTTKASQLKRIGDPIETRLCHVILIFIRASQPSLAQSQNPQSTESHAMKLLTDLFSTDYGLMSLAVIVITLLMGVFIVRMFIRKMNNNE